MDSNADYVATKLYDRLPAVYRQRDAENGYPLRELMGVVAEQIAVVQEGLEQAYDDLFIETCAEWVVPYIGDLIGARPLHGKAKGAGGGRGEVAETIGLRRRKGTLAALEQSARVVTGFPAVAVEFFTRLIQNQYVHNHVRAKSLGTVDMRDELRLSRTGGAFDTVERTIETRRMASGRGRYGIPNIGLFLYRIQSYRLRGATAARVDARRFVFNPLGIDTALYNDPQTETKITEFATPRNVPLPITRIAMKRALGTAQTEYGASSAIELTVGGTTIPQSSIVVCDLSDLRDGTGNWAHTVRDKYGIDPVLGRIALPTDLPAPADGSVVVTFHYGFSHAMGGGTYERGEELVGTATRVVNAASPNLQAALTASSAGGIVEITDSRSYPLASAPRHLQVNANAHVELRAANGARPLVRVTGDLTIEGAAGAEVVLNGLLIEGGTLRVRGPVRSLTLRHCTLVPGLRRTRANEPEQPDLPSLVIEADGVTVNIDRSITGAIVAANGARVIVRGSILDATDESRTVYSGGTAGGTTLPGATLRVDNSTLFGRVHTQQLEHSSNVIFAARAPEVGSVLPVRAERTQDGCVRFSVVPNRSRTPQRYRCVSEPARFSSTRFGTAAYAQLSHACAETIRRGADDESEIGAFHDLYQPQRESDLRTRLDEYLRFGLEAGIFFAS